MAEEVNQETPGTVPETEQTAASAASAEQATAPQTESRFEAKKKEKAAAKAAGKFEKELSEIKTKLDGVEKELAGAKDTLMRTAAEYDNYRKRTTREKEAQFANGVSSAVGALLPVVDTLEMAACAPTDDENYKKGVEMTLAKCKEAFAKLGITEIDAAGQPFDPDLHNAVMQEAAPEGTESGTVTKVLQKGYLLNGKVVRHATVAVAE